MNATYSPEDNKLRLYADGRLDAETYAKVKAAGFKWAPKQELFVAPMWTPAREDLLLELCGEIDDEDYSPEERAADRAERFSDYRDKRAAEAGGSADTFDAGPSAFGHQNRARAERQAMRHDRHRVYAVSQWSKAEYWQSRTKAVIGHALHKSSAPVRRGRILRLEAEQRKHTKQTEDYAFRFKMWGKVAGLDGANVPGQSDTLAYRAAYTLANSGSGWGDYIHPRSGETRSLYCHLTDAQDPITPAEAAALWMEDATNPDDESCGMVRWTRHYELRLTYERAMLAEEGGSAANVEMEPGGWIGGHQIHAVTRSPATGLVTSVKLMAKKRKGDEGLTLQSFNVQRLGESVYRPPTDEEREAFKLATKERKAAAKASKPKTPPLVNPTDEDAQRLQDLWNARAKEKHDKDARNYALRDYIPSVILKMTQEQYSARSKVSHSHFETIEVCEHGSRRKNRYHDNADPSPVAFKIRKTYGGTGISYGADRVIVITDKPRKPLPLDWDAIAAGTTATTKPEAVTA